MAASVTADGSTLVNNDIKAPKNGYAYVYISNQSNLDVYFDNLKVQVVTGNIIEENHYYSYGLKIAAISSKKLGDTYEGTLKNNYLYQGAYSEMDDDIGWNDFALRNYDPQIGRWVQMDPYADYYISSPYAGMGNDPVNTVDPSGGLIASGLFQGATQFGKTVGMMVLGAIAGALIDHASGGEGWTGVALGAAIGIGSSFSFTITAKVVQAANVAVTIINTSTISKQAGTAIRGNNQANSGHGPNMGIGENDLGFANDYYNSSLDFSNDEISIDPDPLVIGPILRWLPKVLKPIWQKGIVPASKWVWRQIKDHPKRQIKQFIEAGKKKSRDVVDYASKNKGAAKPGYKGGGKFENDGRVGGKVLPKADAKGNSITYKEYDLKPYQKGVNRGTERVVVGSDGSAYYTFDHYKTFIKL